MMGKTGRPAVLAHLDQNKLELLDELSALTQIPRAVLIREAVDDLIEKYRSVWKGKGLKPVSARELHQQRLSKATKRK